jgi:hypothetical protein
MARPQFNTPLIMMDLDRWVENVFVVFVWGMEIYLYYPQIKFTHGKKIEKNSENSLL